MNLREFSDLIGLSPTTVSRALGGYPEVSERTRLMVQEAARKHGYRPNRRAASLATGRAMTIGHVIPTAMNHEMVNPVFADFIAGASDVYASAGYDMTIRFVRDSEELRTYQSMIAARSVDGVILHGPRIGDERVALLREAALPFVVHGRVPGEPEDYPYVDVTNTRAFRRATDLLLDLGHQSIALINGHENMDFARRRRIGWEDAHSDRGLRGDPALARSGEMSEQNGFRYARDLLATLQPTAFVVSSLIMAIGVRRAVHAAGLEVGRDVSIVTHDDELGYIGNGTDVPIFTATRSSVRAAGRRCAEILLAQISKNDATPTQELWECDLVIGQSTGPCKARPADQPA